MSYDIWLEIDTGGPEPFKLEDEYWNFTSNVAPMWGAAGADLAEFHDKLAGDCATVLHAARLEMEAHPEKYRAMDSPNGWGTYDDLMPRLAVLAAWFDRHPKATVKVWR